MNEIAGPTGLPKTIVSEQHLRRLVEIDLTVPCISKLLGMSTRTIECRMQQFGITVKGTYSQLTDEELDNLVVAIKIKSNQRMLHLSSLGLSIISVQPKFISNRDLHTHHLLFIISDAAYTRDDFKIFD